MRPTLSWLISLVLLQVLASPLIGQTRIIPHLTRSGGGFSTTVIIENRTINSADYVLTPFGADGAQLRTGDDAPLVIRGALDGQTTRSIPANDLFGGTEASHFLIEGDGVHVTVAYASVQGGSPAHIGETSEQASGYRLFAGDWSSVFDGFAVVNTGTQAADVWVAQRGPDGEIVETRRALSALEPMAKGLYLIGEPGNTRFEALEGAFYEVYSTQNLALTALRGDLPGSSFLWVNEAAPRSRAQTVRDQEAIWHIQGGTLYDVIEAQGYNIAVDRLWQLELHKRNGTGRLGEYFGRGAAMFQDASIRAVGYSQEELQAGYDNLEPQAKIAVKAYVDGVNKRIAEVLADDQLVPAEFLGLALQGILTEITIEPWRPTDVLAFMTALLRQFDPNGFAFGQLNNAAILQDLQADYSLEEAAGMFEDLRWINDPDAITMIPDSGPAKTRPKTTPTPIGPLRRDIDFRALADSFKDQHERREQFLRNINAQLKSGSYAWVVSGEKTDSGNPIIYSGPQMGWGAPAILVEGSIRGGGLDISGMTIPGLPGIIIGRTPHHAWSMQVGHAHTADAYFEPPSALGEPHHVEIIKVNGDEDIEFQVFRTQHGPIVSDSPLMSWRYAHWGKEFGTVQAFLDLARAESMDEFGEALERVAVSQHFCYADRDGNIAYWMSGRDPVRPEGEWRLPQGALAGEPILEWDIEVVKPLAHDRNTPRGGYAGWNNKASKEYDNPPFSSFATHGPFHRANVLNDKLQALLDRGNISFEEVRDLAIDIATTYSIAPENDPWPFDVANSESINSGGGNPWPFIRDAFTQAVEADATEPRLNALSILENWDGHFVGGGEVQWITGMDRADGWMLLDAWLRRTLQLTFDEVSINRAGYAALFNTLLHAVNDGALETNYDWFTSPDPEAAQDFESIVRQALDESLAALGERPWGTNARGTINYFHPFLPGTPIHTTPYSSRSTYAHCVEMGGQGPLRIESMFPLGESGFARIDLTSPNLFSFGEKSLAMAPFYDFFRHREFILPPF